MNSKLLTLVAFAALATMTLAGCAGSTDEPTDDGTPVTPPATPPGTPPATPPSTPANVFGSSTGGTIKSNEVNQAGSSTVFPLAEAWAEEFGGERRIQIKVAGGGSGVGISRLCAKEIDLGDSSRQIRDAERNSTACKNNAVDPVEWKVAYDALSIVISPQNNFLKDASVDTLRKIFSGDANIGKRSWAEVDPSFPNEPIRLCIPGTDSGTLEYFREAILGSATAAYRTGQGVQQSEDDNVLVQCITGDKYAVGYFGLAYVLENPTKVVAIKVNGIAPSEKTVNDKTYTPLSRYLYIYTNGKPTNNLLSDYLRYVLSSQGGQSLISEVGYVKLDSATQQEMLAKLG